MNLYQKVISYLSFLSIFWFAVSCERYPDPSLTFLKDYSFGFQTAQGGKYSSGDWVGDSISFRAVNNKASVKDTFNVVFEVLSGSGTITKQSAKTDSNGMVYTHWRLGSGSCEQKLRAKTYDLSGEYLTSTDLVEYGFNPAAWNTFNGYPENSITGMAADTVNKVTFIVTNSGLYKQGEKYFIWNQVLEAGMGSAMSINIDRNNVFYAGIYGGQISKSIDHGNSWIPCTRPYNDQTYNIYINISNDNYIWVFSYNKKTRFSKDGGVTWNDAGDEISLHGQGDLFRLKDGSVLFHGSDCCSLFRSFDNGLTWTKIETPGYSVKLYVNGEDEIFICTQENGLTFYMSNDYGSTFNKVYSVSAGWIPGMNTFTKWHNYYYVLIPGTGIMKSADLIHYQSFYYDYSLGNLFIDHNGNMIARDWNINTAYYLKNPGN
jgi:hypothetical protein